jgi:hypothetical protein
MVMQIELSDEQAQNLEKIAARKGQSVPELILASVASLLVDEGPESRDAVKRRVLAAIGRYHSGPADLATEHDKYLEEAYGD